MNAPTFFYRTSVAAAAATTAIGTATVVGAATGRSLVPAFPAGALPPAPWASGSILLLGLGLLAIAWRPESRRVRPVVVIAAALILAASLASLATHGVPGLAESLSALHATRPLGGVTLLLASTSLLFTALGRGRFFAGMLGLLVSAMAFVIILGFIYGGPLLMGLAWVPVPLTSAAAALLVGIGLVTAGGQEAWPNRIFIGDSAQAVMLRWLLPMVALAVIVTDLATVNLFAGFSRALGSALNTIISVTVAVVVISYLGRLIGARLERLNASLRDSEQRFTRVFRSAPAGLAISRLDDGRFLEVNDAFERIFGYSRAEAIGRRSTEIGLWGDPADRAAYAAAVAAAPRELRDRELTLQTKSGPPVIIRTSAQVVEFQGQEALLSSFIDVTEQRRAEDALRFEHDLHQRVYELAGVGAYVIDLQTRTIRLSAEMTHLLRLGSDPVEMPLDEYRSRFYFPQDREPAVAAAESAYSGGESFHLESRVVQGDGAVIWVRSSSKFYPDARGAPVVVGLLQDITDSKQAALKLREQADLLSEAERDARAELAERRRVQRRLDLSLHAGRIGTWELDTVSRRFHADQALAELYGIALDSDGTTSWDDTVSRLHPRDVARVIAEIERVQSGVPGSPADFRVIRPDGSLRYVHGASALLPAEGDRPARIVGVNIDVTSQRLAERELRLHKEGLETLVATRTAELRAAKEAAESASRAKSTFLAHMSHEIRTPMNAILGYAQLLQVDGSLDTLQRRKVAAIHTSGDHLLGLLNDILEMSRIEAGRQTLSIEPLDLPALIDGVRSMFTELTAQRGLTFRVETAPDLARGIQSDAGKVRQVLINLVGNATKFTDRGGVDVRVASRDLGDDRCQVTIDVADTGPGIADADREVIFTMFGQAEAGRQRSGTGLGLTISRSVARLLGGDLTLHSTVGRGSTFTFTFVAVRVPDAALPDTSRAHHRQRLDSAETRRKVLVVDDVHSNREILEESLSRAGFETRSAVSGEAAIEVHRQWQPDLVLMDLHMPGMGGMAAMRQLQATRTPAAIIVTTAAADDATAAAVAEVGAAGLLRKPYRESELFETISRVMHTTFVAVPVVTEDAPSDAPVRHLGVLARTIPPEFVAELRKACRQARAGRLVDLAEAVRPHSSAAADAIRELANGFRYRVLLEALEGTHDES